MKKCNYYKLLIICVLLIQITVTANGQGRRMIRGQVIDKLSETPLPGVNVIEQNENNRSLNGTITDINGYYQIEISRETGTVLMFSFIGYKSQSVPIRDQEEINITLAEDVSEIEAVTVTASRLSSTGIESISKRDMTSSVSTISMGEFEGFPATSVNEVLQGRASGVMATAFSGDPGSGMQVRIRGESSISASNDPLYVIDGMPVISESSNSLSELESSPISDIPPEDIESIEILKDASAVALWGTRAANGVVIINTRRGERNRTNVGLTSRLTFKIPRPNIPMLDGDGYKTLMNEADQNRGGETYHQEVITNLLDNIDNPYFEMHNNNTNWADALEETGLIQNYNFNLSGGGNSVRYRFSTSFEDNQGPVITTAFQRFNTSFNLDYDISTKFAISTNISYSNSSTDKKDISDENGYITSSVQNAALVRAPTWPVYLQDQYGNTLQGQYAFQELLVANDRTLTNPVAYINNKISKNESNRLIGKINATMRPMAGLVLRFDLGGDFNGSKDFYFVPPTATGAEPGDPWLRYNKMRLIDGETFKIYGRGTANYAKNFSDIHDLNFTLFSSIDLTKSGSIEAGGNNIASFHTPTLSTAANYAGNRPLASYIGQSNLTSTGVRFQYKLADKYIIGASISQDGSSKFGPENRYAYLPTFSGRWRISSEPFLSFTESIDDLSLRYSWGKSGNGNISDYTYYSRYTSGIENSYAGKVGVQSTNIRLDNIRWETTVQQNISLTGEFFRNRLDIALTYFDKYTTDLLQRNSLIPSTSGFSSLQWFNAGDVSNQGWEVEFNSDVIAKRTFRWEVGFNVSTLKNTIEKLPENGVNEGSDSGAGGYYWRLVEGDPLGSFYGYEFNGVYAEDKDAIVVGPDGNPVYNLGGYNPLKTFNNAKLMRFGNYFFEGGDAIYTDVNRDGLIDEQDILKIGDVNPDLFGGANTTLAYKGLSVSLFFQFSLGNDVINLARMGVEDMYSLNNQSLATQKRWRKQGDQTDMPKAAHLYKNKINVQPSDRFIEDGSYMRIKSMQWSYSIPRDFVRKYSITTARLFFNVTNLYTWTRYLGQDPEVNGRGSVLRGIDKSLTAQPVMYTLGLSVNF